MNIHTYIYICTKEKIGAQLETWISRESYQVMEEENEVAGRVVAMAVEDEEEEQRQDAADTGDPIHGCTEPAIYI